LSGSGGTALLGDHNNMQGLREAQASPAPALRPWRLYLGLLAPSLIVVCTVALLAITSVKVLAAVRAYVSGESLWSKARHEAVQHLLDYAHTRDPLRYAHYENILVVPLGDRQARLEMEREDPDMARIRSGFIQGGNHPDDIDGMVALFRNLGDQPLFSDALAAWVEGDALIDRLRETARTLRMQVERGDSPSAINPTVMALRDINDQLTYAEKRFSASLAEAARVTESLLVGAIVLSAVLLSVISIGVMRRLVSRQAAHQQALQAANERWQLAAAAAEVGLFEIDIDRDLIHMDGRASALYGLGDEGATLPRPQVRQMVDAQYRDTLRQGMNDSVTHGVGLKQRHLTHGADGIVRLLETTGRMDQARKGHGQRMVGVVRDITAEQAQADLAAQRDAAEQVAQAQRAFLSRLSHELRTPLNAILGFAQLLHLDTGRTLSATQAQQVQWILTAGQQLLALVEDVLDLTKVEAGEIRMNLQPVPVCPAMEASLALLDGVATRHQVSFINRLPAQALHVQADPQRLQQVFMNLLSNGCKYNRPGGHVSIDARQEGAQVVIEIADDGIGLSREEAVQLFQPFKRVASTPHVIEGTGLGLYIVKQLVERMGGQVSVDGQPGQGARFTLRLPTADTSGPVSTPTMG
jgi:signal transduction histidine kinase